GLGRGHHLPDGRRRHRAARARRRLLAGAPRHALHEADVVIVHAAPWVVPVAAPPLRDGAVALEGDRVVAVGPLAALRGNAPVVEHGGVLMPGVINAHLHLELSHVRVPGGDGLVPWVRRLLAARGGADADAALAAAHGMAARGTVGAIDISNDGAT